MPLDFKPRLSGENSIITSLATVALVVGLYSATVGPVSDVHASDAHDGNLQAAVKKAGWMSVVTVAGVSLLAKDANIVILGGATIIAEELAYRHALMTNPGSGKIQVAPSAYTPAGGASVTDIGQYASAASG
jgi:hypothetical protein